MSLTAKQQRFIDEYMVDRNGSAAALRAGYSARSAKEIACELLTKPHILAVLRAKEAADAEPPTVEPRTRSRRPPRSSSARTDKG